MSAEQERIEKLFRLFVDGSLTELQRIELEGYLRKHPELDALFADLSDGDAFLAREWADFVAFDPAADTRETNRSGRVRKLFLPIQIAAGLFLFLLAFAAIWFYKAAPNNRVDMQVRTERYKNDVIAGSNRAVATLADGNLLFLGDTVSTHAAAGGNAVALSEGQIRFKPLEKDRPNNGSFNSVTTPHGGQYSVILPDGSLAKLNAGSNIRFPAAFEKKRREVEILGEVYFDVVSDKTRPFIVKLPNGAQIEVLGTSFNVKAYPDDTVIKTTLEKGSVKFKAGEDALLIKPGEQIQLATQASNPVLLKRTVGLDTETSWKDGYFNFENAELKTIMKEVARWYDVDVEYKTQITEQFSILMLPRSFSISRLLELLELTGHVKFTIDGRRVTVMT